MKVYVVYFEYPYEGESTKGVYSTLESAKRAAEVDDEWRQLVDKALMPARREWTEGIGEGDVLYWRLEIERPGLRRGDPAYRVDEHEVWA